MTASPTPLFAEGSGAVPSEEEIARAIARSIDDERFADAPGFKNAARAVLALIAPILAEKEREIEFLRSLASADLYSKRKAAVAAERERCAKIAEGQDGLHCGSLLEGQHAEYYDCGQIDASHSIAAAIRAQGE